MIPLLLLLAQTGGAWEEVRSFVSGSSAEDLFGNDLANVGDVDADGVDDLLVGCPWGTLNPAQSSAALLYSGATGALIRRHDASRADQLGAQVAGGADVDADGVPDYAVLAWGSGASSPGYVDLRSGASGLRLHLLSYSSAMPQAVGFTGDLDGDGIADLAVGTYSYSTYTYETHLHSGATGLTIFSQFTPAGESAFIAVDDVNGDGVLDCAVAAPAEDTITGNSAGGVVRIRSGATWAELKRWEGSGNENYLGMSVAVVPDRDGDGVRDLLMGAPGYLLPGYVLETSVGTGAILRHWDNLQGYGMNLGQSVAAVTDADGDGVADYFMGGGYVSIPGAPSSTGGGWIVSGASGAILHEQAGSLDHEYLGHRAVGMGDLDGDGLGEFAISAIRAPFDPGIVHGAGIVRILGFERFLNASALELDAAAGSSVALEFDFPPSAAGWEYRFLLSVSGAGPTFFGVDVPLSPDALTRACWFGAYPGAMHPVALQGVLGANGGATGSFGFAPGVLSAGVGRTLYAAAVAMPLGSAAPQVSSASLPFVIR